MLKTGRLANLLVLAVLVCSALAVPHAVNARLTAPPPPPPDAPHSTTGPTPPANVSLSSFYTPTTNAITISVPAYTWTHGCGPTLAGMVIGYWDLHGFPSLYPTTNAMNQTTDVNEGIASQVAGKSHYSDYAEPIDDTLPAPQDDCSNKPGCVPHADNSLADFMYTSRASYRLQYGWSYYDFIGSAMIRYIDYINSLHGTQYLASTSDYAINNNPADVSDINAIWSVFTSEINAGRPVIFLLDSNSDGYTDHFVAGTGYDTDSLGQIWFRLNDTWNNSQEHWYPYAKMKAGVPWGIYGITTFHIIHGENLNNHLYLPQVER